jgi:hypothetical protein
MGIRLRSEASARRADAPYQVGLSQRFAESGAACNATTNESGRGLPHSKTLARVVYAINAFYAFYAICEFYAFNAIYAINALYAFCEMNEFYEFNAIYAFYEINAINAVRFC